MGTFELLIVFAALMAVISLVAIAIDWIGRPFKTRRFIPRIYRYEDEFVADPALFDAPLAPVAVPVMAAAPVVVATVAAAAPGATSVPAPSATPGPDLETPTPHLTRPLSGTGSSFREAVQPDDPADDAHGQIARTIPEAAAASWHPGMPLDARVGDRRATVAVKAERYWKAEAAHLSEDHGHFDADARSRMAQGKPPRRRNPRNGDLEAVELVGLRAAANRSDVHMRWPDDAVDPWSAS